MAFRSTRSTRGKEHQELQEPQPQTGGSWLRVRLVRDLEKQVPVAVFRGVSCRGGNPPSWVVYYKSEYVASATGSPNWPAFWDALRTKQQARKVAGPILVSGSATHQLRLTFRAVNGVLAGTWPGDLTAAVQAEADHQAMFTAEPALHLASIHGKYEPWKSALFRAWQELQGEPGAPGAPRVPAPGEGLNSRAKALFRVLSRTAVLLHQVNYKEWDRHCGRHVAHHSGFLALLSDLKVLSHSSAGRKLHLSSAIGAQVPVHTLAPKADTPRLERYILAAECLTKHLREPPSTCAQYISHYRAYRAEVSQIRAPHNGGAYCVPWTWRSACIARMRARSSDPSSFMSPWGSWSPAPLCW